jgi:ribonuclease HII
VNTDLRFFEKKALSEGCRHIAGIDEAGRGPLAGPVVAAAVVLPTDFNDNTIIDSKKLSPKRRQRLYEVIYHKARSIGIGIVDSNEIDRINILESSLLAMAMAVDNLFPKPCFLLIDGKFKIQTQIAQQPIIKGDSLSITIAAASIIAKVTRDRLMKQYALEYPQYGFDQHKGYPTKTHRQAIIRHGCCYIHRKTFRGVMPSDNDLRF